MSLRAIGKSVVNLALAPFGLQIGVRRIGRSFDYEDALQQAFEGVEEPLVLDIGANRGDMVRLVLEKRPKARVVAFEPDPAAYGPLAEFAAQRGFDCHNIALGDRNAKMNFHVCKYSQGSSLLRTSSRAKRLVPGITQVQKTMGVGVRRLDDFMGEAGLEGPVDLMKVDVQGYETQVFKGAAETLKRTRYVLAEAHFVPVYEGACLVDELCHILVEAGFHLVQSIGYLPAARTLDLISTDVFFGRADA